MVRIGVLAGVHAAVAAYGALVAGQWLSVSNGRAGALTLFVPPRDALGLAVPAAVAGALIGPVLHAAVRRAGRSARPFVASAALGVGYAVAVLAVTVFVWIPRMIVAGRGPGRSIGSALADAPFMMVFGAPMFVFTGGLLAAPVLVVGGAAVGLLAMTIERALARGGRAGP